MWYRVEFKLIVVKIKSSRYTRTTDSMTRHVNIGREGERELVSNILKPVLQEKIPSKERKYSILLARSSEKKYKNRVLEYVL